MKAVRQIARIEGQTSITYEIIEATNDEMVELYRHPGAANEWVVANAEIIGERLLD
jgi:hypothetical protein